MLGGRPPAHQVVDRVVSDAACLECRREENEDEESREEEHRDGPRHSNGEVAEAWIHGTLTRGPTEVFRGLE